jgi:hypothetical protein
MGILPSETAVTDRGPELRLPARRFDRRNGRARMEKLP